MVGTEKQREKKKYLYITKRGGKRERVGFGSAFGGGD